MKFKEICESYGGRYQYVDDEIHCRVDTIDALKELAKYRGQRDINRMKLIPIYEEKVLGGEYKKISIVDGDIYAYGYMTVWTGEALKEELEEKGVEDAQDVAIEILNKLNQEEFKLNYGCKAHYDWDRDLISVICSIHTRMRDGKTIDEVYNELEKMLERAEDEVMVKIGKLENEVLKR